MRERLTAIIAIILLVFLIGASYWYAMKTSLGTLRYVPSDKSPDFIATGATVISFDENGVAKTRLRAKEFQHFSDDSMTMVEPQATTVSPNEPVSHAQAKTGFTNDAGATFLFEGDVVVTRDASGSNPAIRLETQSMHVDTDTNRFETDDVVHIYSGRDKAIGTGMIFDNMQRTVELKGRVTTVIEPREGSGNLLPSSR